MINPVPKAFAKDHVKYQKQSPYAYSAGGLDVGTDEAGWCRVPGITPQIVSNP